MKGKTKKTHQAIKSKKQKKENYMEGREIKK